MQIKNYSRKQKISKKVSALGHFFGMYSEGIFFIASQFFEKHRAKRAAQAKFLEILNIL
jgi:hypothetical protein